jgi:pimeloyl-ACP methyl ester carboxylesterase
MKREAIAAISSLLLGLICLSLLYWNDRLLLEGQKFSFLDENGDEIECMYYPGTQDAGILLLHGFSSDQSMMKSITTEYLALGFHVFTFDFSGHGRSGGGLGFDNAASDRLSRQLLVAKEHFKALSGLDSEEIFFLGHSMGARVALWAETFDPNPVRGIILIGCSVNLVPNAQSDFFTGTDDLGLAWIQALDANNPPTDILLITGGWDDILPPESAEALFSKLNGNKPSNPLHTRDLAIVPNVFHNYEPYSPRIIDITREWASIRVNFQMRSTDDVSIAQARIALWSGCLIGMFLFFLFFHLVIDKREKDIKKTEFIDKNSVQISNITLFLKQKIVFWLMSLPIVLLLGLLFFLMPIGIPVFNISYVGLIASYGILLLFLYRKGNVSSVHGEFTPNLKGDGDKHSLLLGVIFGVSSISIGALFINTGIGYPFLVNIRLFWLGIFTILTSIGFYIGQTEMGWVKNSFPEKPRYINLVVLVNILPFYLVIIIFIALASFSGMLGALQGLLFLIFSVLMGNILQKITQMPLLTSVFQALFLQLLILPQGALFLIF